MKKKLKRVVGAKMLAEIDTTFSPAQQTAIKLRVKRLRQEELRSTDRPRARKAVTR